MSNDSIELPVNEIEPEVHDDGPEAFEELRRLEAFDRRGSTLTPVWAPDDQQPDYAHLLIAEKKGVVSPRSFSLTPEVLDLLIEANSFKPQGPRDTFAFGIRGAELATGSVHETVDKVELNEARPDHKDFHCTIGYYHRASRKISAFRASTVPTDRYMIKYFQIINKQVADTGLRCNLLPTGLYRYRIGTHATKAHSVTPALQLANYDDHKLAGVVTVLRTTNELSYRCDGNWDTCSPGDNVHCAFLANGFSSCGCQTVQGQEETGPWVKFQSVLKAMGIGTAIDYVLLTGKEAAIAATLIAKGQAQQVDLVDACLRRLRGGSEGPAVTALQTALGMSNPTGFFGATTRKQMVLREAKLGRTDVKTDLIFSPADEAAFGWTVFKAAATPNATTTGSTSATQPTPTMPGASGQPAGGGGTSAVTPPLGSAGFRPETLILVAGPANSKLSADFKILTVPGEGIWTVGPKIGMLNFAPEPAFSGRTQPVRYEIHDIYNRAATAVASVTVASANRPPLLTEDAGRTFAGQHTSVSVLMNDAAVEGAIDPATLQLAETAGGALTADRRTLTVPGQGVWTVAPGGTIDFAPFTSFIGVARATYQVGTTLGGVATSTVTVTVDPAVGPMQLGDDMVDTSHGQAVAIDVLKNDTFGQAANVPVAVPTTTATAPPATATVPPVTTTPPGTTPVPAGGVTLPAGTVRITPEGIKQLGPRALEKYARAFTGKGDEILARYGINANALRLSHFMAQLAHELGGFHFDVENLNHTSATTLCRLWPNHFPNTDAAQPYLRNPEKLAEKVYQRHPTLGNTAPGDGFRFRGRGLMQLTGRANYRDQGKTLGLDFEGNPDLAMEGENALRVAALFWHTRAKSDGRTMNELADASNIEQITRRINGKLNGLADRRTQFEKAWSIWGTGRIPRSAPDIGNLERGDSGDRVRQLEELLARAGYDPGTINDEFDGQTERAVMLFQHELKRNVDGRVDASLWKALEAAPPRGTGQLGPRAASRGDMRRRPSERDPATLDPQRRGHAPDWLTRHREIMRLGAALLLVAALASLTLGSIGASDLGSPALPKTPFVLPLILAALSAVLFILTAPFAGRDQISRSTQTVGPASAPVEMGGSPEAMPNESAQSSVSMRDRATDDETLRKLGIDPSHFDEEEPIRAEPAPSEDAEPEMPGLSEPQMLVPVGIAPQTTATVRGSPGRGGLEPFNVAAGDARFAIISMFGGDNNLSSQVAYNFNQMVAANRAGGVAAIIGLVDLEGAPASIVEVTPRGEQRTIGALGEIDTGDPETLAKFVSRALISYPNARKAIGFWDHGSGVFKEGDVNEKILTRSTRGAGAGRSPARRLFIPAAERAAIMGSASKRAMLHDNTGGVLTNLEAGHMLEAAFSRAGQSGPVDMIFSDTCLNGMIEVLEELGHYATIVTASAETEPSNGWNYEGWLQRMARQSPQTADDWGRHAVDSFADGYRERPDQFPCTLAAFRSDNLITERFADLVSMAARSGIAGWSLLTIARGRTQQYDTRDSFDIIGFARQLAAIAAHDMPELAQCAQALDQAAREARISHVWMGNDVRGAEGLAFWFPGSVGSYEADIGTYRRLRFAKATGWPEYLGKMYGGAV